METLSLPNRLSDRSRLVRVPAEAADRQVRSFNLEVIEALGKLIEIKPTHRVFVVGGTVGVLAAHLALILNQSGQLVLADPDQSYFESEVPDSLYHDAPIDRMVSYSLNEPVADGIFDRVITYNFVSLFVRDELDFWLNEIRRLLKSDGELVILGDIRERSWRPKNFRTPEDEQERAQRLETLVDELYGNFGRSSCSSPESLPESLYARSWRIRATKGWFQPVRLNDSHWTERQRTDFINLRHQARRDRLQQIRQLMEELGFWQPEYGPLFRQLASDYQQQSLRVRKALETDEETGWSGYETVVLRAVPS